jgi:hypothetical protein
LTVRPRLIGLVAGLLILPLAACRAQVQVRVTLTATGSGTVAATLTLDRQAVAAVGDRVDLSDLRAEGWQVEGPAAAPDGSETLTVFHPFANPAEARALLARLGGPLRLTVTHTRGVTSSSVGLRGVVDLRGGLDALAGSIPALPAGVAAGLASVARAGGTVPTFAVAVVGAFPGTPSRVVGGGRVAGTTVTWSTPLGQTSVLSATSTRTDAAARGWLVASAFCVIALVVVVVIQLGVAARRRRGAADVTPPP